MNTLIKVGSLENYNNFKYNLLLGWWRNRLAQESYTFKVVGSSPAHPTTDKSVITINQSKY